MGEYQVLEVPTPTHTINSTILHDYIIYALLIIHVYVHQMPLDLVESISETSHMDKNCITVEMGFFC